MLLLDYLYTYNMNEKEKTKFLNFKHSRVGAQREQMEQIKKDNVCPFCIEHFTKYHEAAIEKEGEWWMLSKNDFPYIGSSVHYILVYKKHITQPSDINTDAWVEFGEHITFLNNNYAKEGGAMFMRFGNTDYTAASIDHLHAHFVVGVPYTKNAEKLRIPLGYKKV